MSSTVSTNGKHLLRRSSKMEDYALENGWKIIGQHKNELVHFGRKSAYVDVDEVNKTICIYLTADDADGVRVVEYADEISHAVNAVRGVDDGNSVRIHLRNFDDAGNSTLIPYTESERAAIIGFRRVLAKYAEDMDGTGR